MLEALLVAVFIVTFLFTTVGCLFELYRNTHMDALSVHFGLRGPFRIAFSLSPLIVATAVYAWLGMNLWKCRLAKQPSIMKQSKG